MIHPVQKVIHNPTQLSGRGFSQIFYMRSILSQFYVFLMLQNGRRTEKTCFIMLHNACFPFRTTLPHALTPPERCASPSEYDTFLFRLWFSHQSRVMPVSVWKPIQEPVFSWGGDHIPLPSWRNIPVMKKYTWCGTYTCREKVYSSWKHIHVVKTIIPVVEQVHPSRKSVHVVKNYTCHETVYQSWKSIPVVKQIYLSWKHNMSCKKYIIAVITII